MPSAVPPCRYSRIVPLACLDSEHVVSRLIGTAQADVGSVRFLLEDCNNTKSVPSFFLSSGRENSYVVAPRYVSDPPESAAA